MKKERISYSALSAFGKSPNHLLAYWEDKFEPTPAMLFGKLLHKMILEPDVFKLAFAIYEGGARRGKNWESFKDENASKQIITLKEYNIAEVLLNKALENKLFNKLLMATTETEKHIEWTCEGQKYHGYVDMYGEYNGRKFIADIKTCVDAGDKFKRDLLYNDYKLQGAMYLSGTNDVLDYYIPAIEKTTPNNVQVYQLSDTLLEKGYKKYKYLNKKYQEWDGEPQGYSEEIIVVGEPELITI